MNEFLQINIPFPELNKVKLEFQSVCIGCLRRNVPFVALSSCEHASFFEFYFENEVDCRSSVVCQQCHHFLKKIEIFKNRVKECLIALNEQDTNSEPKPLQELQVSIIEAVQIQDSVILKYKVSDDEDKNENSQQHSYYPELNTEIKIEHDNDTFSDNDIDLPLSEIKEGMRKEEKNKEEKLQTKDGIKPGKRAPLNEKYEGKISIVTLSKEEIMKEREIDANKPNYLKLPYKCEHCVVGFDHEETLKEHIEKRHAPKKGGYDCKLCTSVLSTAFSLKEHMKRHTRRYECKVCGKRYINVIHAGKHYNDQHSTGDVIETEFKCNDCGFKTTSYRSYRYHREKHKPKEQCTHCDTSFVNRDALRRHMLTVHPVRRTVHRCPQCDKKYSSKSGLRAHINLTHGSGRGAYCRQCKTCFKSKSNLDHHLKTALAHISEDDKRTVHPVRRTVHRCPQCDKKYSSKSGLRAHINLTHGSGRGAYCRQCKTCFKSKSNLDHHLKTALAHISEDDKRFICDECGLRFIKKMYLQQHFDFVHLKRTNHTCSKCNKVFQSKSSLKRHVAYVHEKIRPPKNKMCDHCGRGFTTLAILQSHVRTHTGERPHQCQKCPATFAHSAALYTHNKLLHNPNKQRSNAHQ